MGWGGDNGGKGGKGKGPSVSHPEKTIWVGNVPQGTNFKDLLEYAKLVGDAKWTEVHGTTAAIGFGSEAEAQSAAASLNGADFSGSLLQTDMWTRKDGGPKSGVSGGKAWGGSEKGSNGEDSGPKSGVSGGKGWGGGEKGGSGVRPSQPQGAPPSQGVVKPQFQKSWDNGKSWDSGKGSGGWDNGKGCGGWGNGGGKGKGKSKGSKISHPDKTVWIGSIPEGTKFQELLELAKQFGSAKWAEVWKTTGAVGFSSAEEAVSAVASLNGATLGSSAIEADLWERGKKQQ